MKNLNSNNYYYFNNEYYKSFFKIKHNLFLQMFIIVIN